MSIIAFGCGKALEMLFSDERGLRELAEISGRPTFDFFRGADLRGLNLASQDLRGMNFDNADLRFSNVENIKFDTGAFNASFLDRDQEWLKDPFEYYIDDLEAHNNYLLLIFVRIRPELIENIIQYFSLSYRQFSSVAGVGEAALRKARNGGVIAWETAMAVMKQYQDLASQALKSGEPRFADAIRQPCLEFLSGGTNGAFNRLTRSRLADVMLMQEHVRVARKLMYPNERELRDTPEFIESMYNFYMNFVSMDDVMREMDRIKTKL